MNKDDWTSHITSDTYLSLHVSYWFKVCVEILDEMEENVGEVAKAEYSCTNLQEEAAGFPPLGEAIVFWNLLLLSQHRDFDVEFTVFSLDQSDPSGRGAVLSQALDVEVNVEEKPKEPENPNQGEEEIEHLGEVSVIRFYEKQVAAVHCQTNCDDEDGIADRGDRGEEVPEALSPFLDHLFGHIFLFNGSMVCHEASHTYCIRLVLVNSKAVWLEASQAVVGFSAI